MTENTDADRDDRSAQPGAPDERTALEGHESQDTDGWQGTVDVGESGTADSAEDPTEPEEPAVVAHAESSERRPWCIGYS
jgi:hypothetical protein